MKCFVLSRDLMFSSQVSSAANSAGFESSTIANAAQIAEQPANDDQYIVIFDLTMPGLDIAATTEQLKERSPAPTKLIAVGPHVHEGKLNAAHEAGCDLVMTRGQASRELGSLLAQFND